MKSEGATWNNRIIKTPEGETKVLLYDILTADDLMHMDLDAMSAEELRELLPNVVDLLDNLESFDPEDEEWSEDECEEIQDDMDQKAEAVEEILQNIRERLGIHP